MSWMSWLHHAGHVQTKKVRLHCWTGCDVTRQHVETTVHLICSNKNETRHNTIKTCYWTLFLTTCTSTRDSALTTSSHLRAPTNCTTMLCCNVKTQDGYISTSGVEKSYASLCLNRRCTIFSIVMKTRSCLYAWASMDEPVSSRRLTQHIV